jgi:transposase IS66 family protein
MKVTAFLLVMSVSLSSSFNPLKTQNPELIDQLKERLPQALFEKLKDSLSVDGDRLRLGREREGPKRFLGNFEGILQTDGYAAYDHVGGARMIHAACWAHARRKFFQAVELNPKARFLADPKLNAADSSTMRLTAVTVC